MLRTFTHSILEKHPELIPIAFPEIYKHWDASQTLDDPTYTELIRCFERILAKLATFSKLCIIIDGVDEFEKEHRDMSEFIHSLANSKVKVIVSSRPINTCLQVFRACPTLRLQDLTKNDMDVYIQGQLASHPIMRRMMESHSEESSKILSDLRGKAQGVFLWVKFVVRILVEGVDAGDDFQELLEKLRLVPNDLKELYRRMFSKIEPEYQTQAAKIFRLLDAWYTGTASQVHGCVPLMLHFAMQPPCHKITEDLDLETIELYHCRSVAQIRNHCCGLLEAYASKDDYDLMRAGSDPLSTSHEIKYMMYFKVDYIHRTAQEFISSEDVWKEVLGWMPLGFDPQMNLISACLRIVKIHESLRLEFPQDYILSMMSLYKDATPHNQVAMNAYIDALDEAMIQLQKSYSSERIKDVPAGESWFKALGYFDHMDHEWDGNPEYQLDQWLDMGCFAASLQLTEYVKYCTEKSEMGFSQKIALVLSALGDVHYTTDTGTLMVILRYVASTEDDWGESTLFRISMYFDQCMKKQTRDINGLKELRTNMLLGCFVVAARSPKNIIREYSSMFPGRDFSTVIQSLKAREAANVKALGDQVDVVLKDIQEHEDPEISAVDERRRQTALLTTMTWIQESGIVLVRVWMWMWIWILRLKSTGSSGIGPNQVPQNTIGQDEMPREIAMEQPWKLNRAGITENS
jgi:hypothetical protein